ncbi:MAG TPA: hypothetical protein DCZ51_11395 [Bacteroidales bacterium]|nr:hypothetical protein [Bacteroidales bacterium]
MKTISNSILVFLILILASGCSGQRSSKPESDTAADTLSVSDTGYTGITKYYSNDYLIKEVTFKNGVMQGEMRTYYQDGQLNQTIWYENGLREDSAKKYYLEGQVFRSTPFKHDTIDGTQIQYYRNGRVKARLKFIKGVRTPFLEEYKRDGKLIGEYPSIQFTIDDNYNKTGKIRINLTLSDTTRKARFYRGEFTNGVFDTTKCVLLPAIRGKTYLELKKSGNPGTGSVGIIGAIITDFGNRYLTYKKIDLPYKDIN